MRKGRTLFFKLLVFFPLLLVIAAVNCLVDPADLYTNKDFEKAIVRQNAAGHTVVLLKSKEDYDSRYVVKEYVRSLEEKKEVLVLGSSRVYMLSADAFPGKTFYNAAVSAATLEDDIAIYGLFHERGLIPSVVVIGIDPWILDGVRARQTKPLRLLSESYHYMMRKMHPQGALTINIPDYLPVRVIELFSFSYFHAGLSALKQNGWRLGSAGDRKFEIAAEKYNKFLTFLPDGSRMFGEEDRNRLLEEVDLRVETRMREFGRYREVFLVDSGRKKLFEDFVDWMIQDKVQVIFYFPPYHPKMFAFHNGEMPSYTVKYGLRNMDKVEDCFREVAAKKKIKIFGSYSAKRIGVPADRFFDEMHLRTAEDTRISFKPRSQD